MILLENGHDYDLTTLLYPTHHDQDSRLDTQNYGKGVTRQTWTRDGVRKTNIREAGGAGFTYQRDVSHS